MCNWPKQRGERSVSAAFSVLDRHMETARPASRGGRLVLSQLAPGRSVVGVSAPPPKRVLEGEEIHQTDGRRFRAPPGHFLYGAPGDALLGRNRVERAGLCLAWPADW